MSIDQLLPPLQRDAVLAMHHSPTGELVRRGPMYAPAGTHAATSGKHAVQVFTKRLVLKLEREGLVHLDDDEFPEHVTLNAYGRQIAERIAAKAVR